ncbi:MAG TPA: PGPGW domain-containing protein, partial [Actinomycetota bacterium]|nr:PGPGW domain-containing protein [Actinomycetota bacterium]
VLLLAGGVMVVTPGPGLVVIILGLVVLGTEYAWARRALEKARDRAKRTADRIRRRDRRAGTEHEGGR